MPRRGRGGKRTGRIGAPYSNRSDLQQPRADFTGQVYGEGVRQRARQQAVPVAGPPALAPTAGPATYIPPGAVTPLNAPTQRPDEPLTTGLRQGPGAGPEVLTLGGPDDASTLLRRLYAAYPSEDLRALIEFNEGV